VKWYVWLAQSVPSVRFKLQKYLVPACVKLVLVCVMFIPGLVVLVAKSSHVPVLLLRHVATSVSPPSRSLQVMYSGAGRQCLVVVLLGSGPVCVGGLFAAAVVKL